MLTRSGREFVPPVDEPPEKRKNPSSTSAASASGSSRPVTRKLLIFG